MSHDNGPAIVTFCANCGRQRTGTGRFCGGCGAQFSDPVPDRSDEKPHQEDAASPSPAPGATRFDVDPGVTRVDPAPQADSFASWYQPEAPSGGQDADTNWQPTQTVPAAPAKGAGYLPPSYPPPPVSPPGAPTAPPSRGNRGRGLFIAVAAVVVLAAGGGAYALATSLGKHSTAQPSATPTASASRPSVATTPPTTSPATSTPPTPTPTPSPTLSLVAISPSVTPSAAEPKVETLLSHYFHGINTHNYAEYSSTLNAQQLAGQSQSQFESGYSSTTDSGMTLTSLSSNSSGGLTATVTFTSRQSPADSVDHSSCNAWTLNFYLVQQGSGYLIGPEPSGYQPTYSDC